MKSRWLFLTILLSFLVGDMLAQEQFDTSLHSTREGKKTAYAAKNGGMEVLTGIPMENLACQKCHSTTEKYPNGWAIDSQKYQPGCLDCHDMSVSAAVPDATCLNCHNRQVYERQAYPGVDVHQKAGMTCTACHSKEEIHGDDGVKYASLKEPGAIKAKCENCHTNLAENPAHALHKETVDCAACHAKGILTCASCHFESLVATGKNRGINQLKNYKLLVKKDGKVGLGSFMTHTVAGKTNMIISSYHSHAISKEASDCKDCHFNMGKANAAIQEYNTSRSVRMTKWNESTKKIGGPAGVVPVPADWRTAFKFDYAVYKGDPAVVASDPNAWAYLKSETDNAHLFYAEPLDAATMKKLGFQVSHLESEFSDLLYFPLFGDGTQGNIQLRSSLMLTSVGADREVIVEFRDRAGNPMPVLMGEQGPASSFNMAFARGHSFTAKSPGTAGLQIGSAVVKVKRAAGASSEPEHPPIGGTVVFTRADNGITVTEAGVPAARPLKDFTLFLDSIGAKDTGLALMNPPGTDTTPGAVATVIVRVWDKEQKNQIGQAQFSMQPGQALGRFIWEIFQDAGASPDLVGQLQEGEGMVTVSSDVPLAALTLRQNDDGAVAYPSEVPLFTAFPVIPGRADSAN